MAPLPWNGFGPEVGLPPDELAAAEHANGEAGRRAIEPYEAATSANKKPGAVSRPGCKRNSTSYVLCTAFA
jgi:hypothetical protein